MSSRTSSRTSSNSSLNDSPQRNKHNSHQSVLDWIISIIKKGVSITKNSIDYYCEENNIIHPPKLTWTGYSFERRIVSNCKNVDKIDFSSKITEINKKMKDIPKEFIFCLEEYGYQNYRKDKIHVITKRSMIDYNQDFELERESKLSKTVMIIGMDGDHVNPLVVKQKEYFSNNDLTEWFVSDVLVHIDEKRKKNEKEYNGKVLILLDEFYQKAMNKIMNEIQSKNIDLIYLNHNESKKLNPLTVALNTYELDYKNITKENLDYIFSSCYLSIPNVSSTHSDKNQQVTTEKFSSSNGNKNQSKSIIERKSSKELKLSKEKETKEIKDLKEEKQTKQSKRVMKKRVAKGLKGSKEMIEETQQLQRSNSKELKDSKQTKSTITQREIIDISEMEEDIDIEILDVDQISFLKEMEKQQGKQKKETVKKIVDPKHLKGEISRTKTKKTKTERKTKEIKLEKQIDNEENELKRKKSSKKQTTKKKTSKSKLSKQKTTLDSMSTTSSNSDSDSISFSSESESSESEISIDTPKKKTVTKKVTKTSSISHQNNTNHDNNSTNKTTIKQTPKKKITIDKKVIENTFDDSDNEEINNTQKNKFDKISEIKNLLLEEDISKKFETLQRLTNENNNLINSNKYDSSRMKKENNYVQNVMINHQLNNHLDNKIDQNSNENNDENEIFEISAFSFQPTKRYEMYVIESDDENDNLYEKIPNQQFNGLLFKSKHQSLTLFYSTLNEIQRILYQCYFELEQLNKPFAMSTLRRKLKNILTTELNSKDFKQLSNRFEQFMYFYLQYPTQFDVISDAFTGTFKHMNNSFLLMNTNKVDDIFEQIDTFVEKNHCITTNGFMKIIETNQIHSSQQQIKELQYLGWKKIKNPNFIWYEDLPENQSFEIAQQFEQQIRKECFGMNSSYIFSIGNVGGKYTLINKRNVYVKPSYSYDQSLKTHITNTEGDYPILFNEGLFMNHMMICLSADGTKYNPLIMFENQQKEKSIKPTLKQSIYCGVEHASYCTSNSIKQWLLKYLLKTIETQKQNEKYHGKIIFICNEYMKEYFNDKDIEMKLTKMNIKILYHPQEIDYYCNPINYFVEKIIRSEIAYQLRKDNSIKLDKFKEKQNDLIVKQLTDQQLMKKAFRSVGFKYSKSMEIENNEMNETNNSNNLNLNQQNESNEMQQNQQTKRTTKKSRKPITIEDNEIEKEKTSPSKQLQIVTLMTKEEKLEYNKKRLDDLNGSIQIQLKKQELTIQLKYTKSLERIILRTILKTTDWKMLETKYDVYDYISNNYSVLKNSNFDKFLEYEAPRQLTFEEINDYNNWLNKMEIEDNDNDDIQIVDPPVKENKMIEVFEVDD